MYTPFLSLIFKSNLKRLSRDKWYNPFCNFTIMPKNTKKFKSLTSEMELGSSIRLENSNCYLLWVCSVHLSPPHQHIGILLRTSVTGTYLTLKSFPWSLPLRFGVYPCKGLSLVLYLMVRSGAYLIE